MTRRIKRKRRRTRTFTRSETLKNSNSLTRHILRCSLHSMARMVRWTHQLRTSVYLSEKSQLINFRKNLKSLAPTSKPLSSKRILTIACSPCSSRNFYSQRTARSKLLLSRASDKRENKFLNWSMNALTSSSSSQLLLRHWSLQSKFSAISMETTLIWWDSWIFGAPQVNLVISVALITFSWVTTLIKAARVWKLSVFWWLLSSNIQSRSSCCVVTTKIATSTNT